MSTKNASPMKYIVIMTLLIAVLLAAIVMLNNKAKPKDEALESHPSTENQPTIGEEDAPVSIVEFGDFKCPACKAWGEQIYPKVKGEFIDTGKANLTYVNVLFHGEESILAAQAAESVFKHDPDSYWEFQKELYKEQPEGGNHEAAWVTVDKLVEVAEKTTDVDIEQLKKDVEGEAAKDQLNIDTNLVEKFSVEQTPTIIINGTKLEDPYDYERIRSIIEEGQK
ncbi:thioredoxin domain-containing protein [Rossellomorea sp. NS-SX7]|uniref:thioredoxin domain-containing protein n=1 Tax=Rossellomorea sp. NS-SX7 TaxID=3463856 RepID=UPI00405992A7